jgi:N-acetylmuramoyl-L-alanine amidase
VLGNGEVVAGRHINKTGSHCKGKNKGSIGICVTGNTNNEAPTTQQMESLWGKVKMLMDEYDLTRQDVYGHRDFSTSECPGNYLYAFLQQFKQGLMS